MTALLNLQSASAQVNRAEVLSDVSLEVRAGELVALCGPNGAGKSSVLKAALGLLPLSHGVAQLGGEPLAALSDRQRAERAAYLPQERQISWNLPAIEVVALGLPFLKASEGIDRALKVLDQLGAGHLASRGVADMSGGERAKVLLARAMVTEAPLLLADEPVAALDPDAQLLVLDQLRGRARDGRAVLVSLHDLGLAARFADRVVVLDQGRVVADDVPVKALSPEVLKAVFRLDAHWIETDGGPLLAARRSHQG